MLNKKDKQQTASGVNNRLLADTSFTGDISSKSDFRIDGIVIGNLNIEGRLVVGKSARIEGEIKCTNADIEGKVQGTVWVQDMLSLRSSAEISGSVVVKRLLVEPGAVLNMDCKMDVNG